ncbi:MAG: glycoside hydrolase family 55 protein, partial [Alicyclobacillus sp.]|nr:glycoside hydrolase family 55 protein [Alicyclobacillus sp.]
MDYGADPSGTKDSTTAIQNAVNAAGNRGGTVIFPPGQFLISSPITLQDGICITGSGMPQTNPNTGSIIIANTAMNAMFQTNLNGTGQRLNNLAIEKICLNGNNNATYGLYLDSVINQKGDFRDLYILNATNTQVWYSGATTGNAYGGNYVTFRNCVFSSGQTGIYINADWVVLDSIFCSGQTAIPFHFVGGLGNT